MDSILTSIKKLLGITPEYKHFDADIVLHINSVFMVLNQLGVGPAEGFTIADEYSTWSEFLGDDHVHVEAVKTYVYLRVKMLFDPPQSSAVVESMKRTIDELEWRLNAAVDFSATTEQQGGGLA